MIEKSLLTLLATALACSAAFAQQTEADLLKQIDILNPNKVVATPEPVIPRATAVNPALNPALNPQTAASTPVKPSTDKANQPGGDKAKGPTEITALQATFDQRKNVAVFIGSVVVKDPEFNVVCDKLTAYLKHDDKGAAPSTAAPGKTTPKPVTPKPATPKPGAQKADPSATPAPKGGGLDSAVAETTSERRVIITQDKVEADGSITHGIGISDWAYYKAETGDIVLWGMPDVTQGVDRCIATDPSTVMTLTRDGKMTAKGPHRTLITDTESSRTPTK